jgi:hypothetical protein
MAAQASQELMTQKSQDKDESSFSASLVQRLYSRYLEPRRPSWVDVLA